jgi:putative ABC transport system permease protein
MRSAAIRVYSALLYLYPPALRRAHGREMLQCASAAVARRGARALAPLLVDTAAALPREWLGLFRGVAMTGLAHDVVHAFRMLRRDVTVTLAVIATLALGIGANTAIFSLADATLLRPLQVSDVDQLYALNWSTSYPDYRAFAARGDLFEGAAATSGGRVNLVADGDAALVDAGFVSGNYFGVLGVPLLPAAYSDRQTMCGRDRLSECSATAGGNPASEAIQPSSDAWSARTDSRSRSSALPRTASVASVRRTRRRCISRSRRRRASVRDSSRGPTC